MAFKRQRNFTHKFDFSYEIESGEQETRELTVVYRTMPRDVFIEKFEKKLKDSVSADQATLDIVLVSVDGLVVEDESGKVLAADVALEAMKQDPALSFRLNEEYSAGLKGNSHPAT